jgi:hypothetical protein
MQVGRITAEIRRFGAVATVIWTAPAVLSLTASLYGFVTDNSIDEIDVILAIVGAIALGFAIGSHAMALALEKIAIGVSLAVAAQSSDTLLTQAHACNSEESSPPALQQAEAAGLRVYRRIPI